MNELPRPSPGPTDLTTLHVQRARQGDADSRVWVVEHFTPALLLQANYRLQDHVRRFLDPEDLVQDVWAITLPRLPHLEARDGRWTPVLVKFLCATLLNQLRGHLRSHLRARRGGGSDPLPSSQSERSDPLQQIPDEVTGVVTRIANRELEGRIHECLAKLNAHEREIVVLRGLEQLSNKHVAELLGKTPATISVQYHRALERLRTSMPSSVFAELPRIPEETI